MAKRWSDLSIGQKGLFMLSGILQIGLLVADLVDIYRQPEEEIQGNKWTWVAATFVNFIGPIFYFLLFGRNR